MDWGACAPAYGRRVVRPKVWPHFQGQVMTLEDDHDISRLFSTRATWPVSQRLGLDSLELRRLRFDLINYFKVLNNLSPIAPCDHFLIHHPIPSSRSSMPYLQKPLRSNSKLSSSFFYRQVDAWNYLPCALKASSSLTSFKSAIKKINFSSFHKGNSLKQL